MPGNTTRRLNEAITELLETFVELQDTVEEDLGLTSASDEEDFSSEDLESGLVNEVRAALELVMENDDYKVDDVATLISCITEALEEIDPSIFLQEDDDEDIEDEDDDEDIDDMSDLDDIDDLEDDYIEDDYDDDYDDLDDD